MAKPGGKFVGYQDLTREEIRELMINSFLDDYKLVILPGGRIFFTLERLQVQYQLASFRYLMSYAYVRRPMRMICEMYRKVKVILLVKYYKCIPSRYRPWRPLGRREVSTAIFSDIRH